MFPCPDKGGYRRFGYKAGKLTHTGHDFNSEIGTEVKAVADGTVMIATQMNGFGSIVPTPTKGGVVFIRHRTNKGKQFIAMYGHIEYVVGPGDTVKEGDVIGSIADFTNNGDSWPHLHLGIYNAWELPSAPYGYTTNVSKWVNPVTFIKENLL